MRGDKRGAGSLAKVIKPPINSVEIEMHESAASRRVAHRHKSLAHPLITQIIPAVPFLTAPMQPGIIVPSSKDQCFKLDGRSVTEKWIVEPGRPVLFLEQEAEGMLWRLERLTIPPALDSQSAIHAKANLDSFWIKQLGRGGSFPGRTISHRM